MPYRSPAFARMHSFRGFWTARASTLNSQLKTLLWIEGKAPRFKDYFHALPDEIVLL
jgi:hypothetical protein